MHLITFITKIFHFLPEEIAHRFALSGLRIVYESGLLKILLGKKVKGTETLDNSFDKKVYKNKLGIAAGLDKDGEYIKTYLPQLKYLSKNEIHLPERTLLRTQYPKPIVEHKFARSRALRRYKKLRENQLWRLES